jgi:GT2 family glycosyltransferase
MSQIIYILLPVHNRKLLTVDFINCLKKQSYNNFELILIDDGSTDGTSDYVKQNIKNLTVITGDGNLWWAGSLNAGINCLEEKNINDNDIILIINDDVIIDKEFLSTGINMINAMPDSLLLAQYRDKETGEIQETGIDANLIKLKFNIATSKEQINCLPTRGLFLLWSSLKKIGMFNSLMLPHYGSDYEFTIRALKHGFKLRTESSLTLINRTDVHALRQMIEGTFKERIKCLFDRRYVKNPIYWTNFVILICPWYMIVPNIIKVWVRAVSSLFVHVRTN